MYEIKLCSVYGSPRKRVGKLVITRQWQECDKFTALKAAPFEGSVFDIRAATGKGRKVTILNTPEDKAVEAVREAIEDNKGGVVETIRKAVPTPPEVDQKTGFIKAEPEPKIEEDKNVLYDEDGNVIDEAVMLVPDEPKEEPKGPEEIEGVEVVIKEVPESDEPLAEADPEMEKPTVKKAKKKGGKSGKKKR